MAFDAIPKLLSDALVARGYEALTPVQDAVLEPEARGRDLVVSAQTGSGKTVAFGLAMATELLDENGYAPVAAAPLALIIAPTRELALQVSREFIWLYGPTGARIATCVGGMDASKERRALSQGAQIVVGTPGRLRDHLERGALNLSALKAVVLDEADEMLDMGFREDLEELLDATPEGRRTLLFSATMPKPIVALAKRYQQDALRISTVTEDRGHGDISYQAVTVAPADIENAVVNLLRLHEAPTAMLFCATRDNVRHLHASLIERGFAAVALSGEHSQNERNQALQALRDRRARVCVATDVAARGIDLPSLSLVIHVELPRDAETLQHRSGRTGRAGKKGVAVLLVPYPRRRRVEMMLRGARIAADWINPPTPEDIRIGDRERLIEALLQPVEIDDEDRALAQRLIAEKTPEEIAAALVRAHRARMPAPEELIDVSSGPPARLDGPRAGFEDTIWFRMDIGRNHNADPRWVLPLLCRRGHITRTEIGAIRITANETMFEVPRGVAGRFAEAVKRTANDTDDEGSVKIEATDGKPREEARRNRREDGGGERREPRTFAKKSPPPRATLGTAPRRSDHADGGQGAGGRPAYQGAGDKPGYKGAGGKPGGGFKGAGGKPGGFKGAAGGKPAYHGGAGRSGAGGPGGAGGKPTRPAGGKRPR
ncbi:DEAD/DEAH box helicase [Aquisediminimonas sediminicola]|uniref:DEAD/DEAH box helicase n=1 Tax=Alteraquisediminimonas sediminicola TaxID=2676787 RepID=UPI001C8E51C1|nr:DEAD/DEAH box helicase [Aquisediminimonas sediminicola]